ncbi:hypothetical protein CCM_04027 [Cordyceps militaris CM01]|uniref:Uncharacterized protein n=1 Tax=Cordyceps militaris (strain CM01) TaxID=983644 RepID=G3JDH9_CORMM|nr:uncharacterized protein CCM_04027 [Cordyceps militaris CM01]EGX92654.1 hypothetical protein CCM_04027 [Cordyceps militaris CM01]
MAPGIADMAAGLLLGSWGQGPDFGLLSLISLCLGYCLIGSAPPTASSGHGQRPSTVSPPRGRLVPLWGHTGG